MRIVALCTALLIATAFTWTPANAGSVDSCIAACGNFAYPGSTPPLSGDSVDQCVGSCSAYAFMPEGGGDAHTSACVPVYANCFVDRSACESACRNR